MKTALLEELADTWEVMAEMEQAAKPGRRETLRECVDMLRTLAAANVAPAEPSARERRLEELLTSAAAIAGRRGAGTAWDRFGESIRAEGIGQITARTYRVLRSDDASEVRTRRIDAIMALVDEHVAARLHAMSHPDAPNAEEYRAATRAEVARCLHEFLA